MKKIDLNIHTVHTISDSAFTFSLDTFKRYVKDARLDAVAVTNHDVFDGAQFRLIQQALDTTAFPGIEINVEKGHILIIGNASELDDFESKASLVSQKITKPGDSIFVEELRKIYGDLNNYLVIPHYDKAPPIAGDTLENAMNNPGFVIHILLTIKKIWIWSGGVWLSRRLKQCVAQAIAKYCQSGFFLISFRKSVLTAWQRLPTRIELLPAKAVRS